MYEKEIAVLERVRETMSDPSKVVNDPERIWEGRHSVDERMCVIGWVHEYAYEMDVKPGDVCDSLAGVGLDLGIEPTLHRAVVTQALAEGRHLEVIDATIENYRQLETIHSS